MSKVDPTRVLFVGHGTTAVCYYRVMLPAMAIGADWCGIMGAPPKLGVATSMIKTGTEMPDMLDDYDIVVLQQPSGDGWIKTIKAMQERGVRVVYEVDDYVHGIRHMSDHDFAKEFGKDYLARAEEAMAACDALIASTPYIRKKYKKFQPNAFVCRNGIDIKRYDLERPARNTVNIGWAGATGHFEAVKPWFVMTGAIMRARPKTCFVSVGRPFAEGFKPVLGEDRAISVPWAALEQYPAAMTMMDIALAPGGEGGFWRGKSDLRWLEAGALGIPIIANPIVYPDIDHEVTGMKASDPKQMAEALLALIDNPKFRTMMGNNVRDYIREKRSIEAMAPQWLKVFEKLLADG